MKCPKCGYISFDNNQVCPKCNRDISYEQEKLNFPAFRPNPPALLGAMTGDVIESHVDMQIDQSYSDDLSTNIVTEEDVHFEDSNIIGMGDVTSDDSGVLNRGDVVFNDSQDMDADLELGETNEFEAPEGFDSLREEESVADIDLDSLNDISGILMEAGEPENDGMAPLESTEEEGKDVSFNVEDLSLKETDLTWESHTKETEEKGEEPGIDFDSMALEESDSMGEPLIEEPEDKSEKPGIDFDSMALEENKEAREAIELGLEDLQIDESGELEIRSEADDRDSETDSLLDLEDIDLDLDMNEEDK